MDEILPEQDTETVDTALEPPDATGDVEPASFLKKRGRPKGSKDAHPRTRTKPETHTPSKAYIETESPLLDERFALGAELHEREPLGALLHEREPLGALLHAMADARQQELIKKQNLYQSWLPY